MEYKRKRGRKTKAPPKSTFDYQYYILQIPAEEMAKEYGVKLHTIYNWASMYREKEQE